MSLMEYITKIKNALKRHNPGYDQTDDRPPKKQRIAEIPLASQIFGYQPVPPLQNPPPSKSRRFPFLPNLRRATNPRKCSTLMGGRTKSTVDLSDTDDEEYNYNNANIQRNNVRDDHDFYDDDDVLEVPSSAIPARKPLRPVPPLSSSNRFSRIPDLIRINPQNGYYNHLQSSTAATANNSWSLKKHTSKIDIQPTRSFMSTWNIKTKQEQLEHQQHREYQRLLSSVGVKKQTDQHVSSTFLSKSPGLSNGTQGIFSPHRQDTSAQQQSSIFNDDRFAAMKLDDTIPIVLPPVNSLLPKLESIPAFNDSWIPTMQSRYSKALSDRKSLIEHYAAESKTNEAETRRSTLNYRKQSLTKWSVADVVLVEDDEPEINDFPELSEDQLRYIYSAMNDEKKTTQKFNLTITRRDLDTLDWMKLNWLNDEIINFYMNLLIERGDKRCDEGYPKVHAMNTFFLTKLMASGHAGVRRWTRRVDIFAVDIIPVPVHVGGVHWCMAIIHLKNKTIKYYDSMGSPNQSVLLALENYLKEESRDKRKMEFDMSGWTLENVQDCPKQQNGSDCGVFSCMVAEFITRSRPLIFSQKHMQYFRMKMVWEISKGEMIL